MDMHQKREMRKNKKKNEDKKSLPSTSINWYPGHMAKTKRQIKERDRTIQGDAKRKPGSQCAPDLHRDASGTAMEEGFQR